jgi:hypothetical protein
MISLGRFHPAPCAPVRLIEAHRINVDARFERGDTGPIIDTLEQDGRGLDLKFIKFGSDPAIRACRGNADQINVSGVIWMCCQFSVG